MTMRQRRKKLTTTISRLDSRVRTVEFKAPTGVASSTAAVDPANDIVTPEISVRNDLAPNSWVRVTGGWYYPQQYIGQKQDRIEYYHEGIIDGLDSTGKTAIRVSGVYSDRIGVRASNANKPSDDQHPESPLNFAVYGHNYPTGATRDKYPWYEDVPAGMEFEVCSPNVDLPIVPYSLIQVYLSPQQITYRSLVVSVSATTTHGTIVFDSSDPLVEPHYFKVGDVLSTLDLDAPFTNNDGIIQVTSVATDSITFKFQTAIADPISSTSVSEDKYVYAVMQKYTRIGSTWIQPVTGGDDQVYVWDGVRYVSTASLPAGTLVDDGIAPSPPTILSATVENITDINAATGKIAAVKITLEAPTTNSDGSALDDLFGYTIKWRKTSSGDWQGQQEVGPDLEHTIGGLTVASTYYFGAFARDYKRLSTVSNIYQLDITKPAIEVGTPSAPTVAPPRLGTVSVSWDGNTSAGLAMPLPLLNFIEVHVSTTSGFTPSSSTIKGYISSPGGLVVLSDLTYGTTYYVKFIAVDLLGNKTAASTQTATGTIKALVDTDVIGKVLSGAKIVDGTITASDAIIGNTITGGLIQALAIDAGKLSANSIIASKIRSGSIDGQVITGAQIQTYGPLQSGTSYSSYSAMVAAPGATFGTIRQVGGNKSYTYVQNFDPSTGNVYPIGHPSYGGTWSPEAYPTGRSQRLVMSGNEFAAYNSAGEKTVSIVGDTATIKTSIGSNAIGLEGSTNSLSIKQNGSIVAQLAGSAAMVTGSATGAMLNYGSTAANGLAAHLFLGSDSFELLSGATYGIYYDQIFNNGMRLTSESNIFLEGDIRIGAGDTLYIGDRTPQNAGAWYNQLGFHFNANGTAFVTTSYASGGVMINRDTAGAVMSGWLLGSIAGRVMVNTGTIALANGSDYRMKENILPINNASSRLMRLKPVSFNYLIDSKKELVEGFIAHEVADIVPRAVYGEKDAVTEDGDPDYQGLDLVALVPVTVAALQESIETIRELSDRLSALENK